MLVAFIDTNALLHFPPLKDVDWCTVCGDSEVTIMLCQPVLGELDKHKQNPRLSDRARARSREIEANLNQQIRPGVTIRFYSDPLRFADFPDTLSPDSVDDQIVHCAVQYKQKHGGTVAIITDDTLMRLRSEGHGIMPVAPPEHQRQPNPQTEDQKKLRDAQAELADLKNRRPNLGLTIEPQTVTLTKPNILDPKQHAAELEQRILTDNPRYHGAAHVVRQYCQKLEVWLAEQKQLADESARTIKFEATLHNSGRSPANGVDLAITFPATVVAMWHERQPSGNRLWQASHRQPQSPGFKVELPEPVKTFPPEMNSSYARPVDFGRITSRSYHVFIDVFPHAETKKFLPFYVTLGRWEDATIFTIDVRIRTNEPADLHEFQVPIDLAVERADVNRINPG